MIDNLKLKSDNRLLDIKPTGIEHFSVNTAG